MLAGVETLTYESNTQVTLPGSKAAVKEVRDLSQGLQRLRGFHGFITVNGRALPLAAAATRAVSLLKKGWRVKVKFYDQGSGALEILDGRERPVLILTAESVEELRRELCSELFRGNAWLECCAAELLCLYRTAGCSTLPQVRCWYPRNVFSAR